MNPRLSLLQPYPTEKLQRLIEGITPPSGQKEIRMAFGEPQHGTPDFIQEALVAGREGLADYPAIRGGEALRASIARWIATRYRLPPLDAVSQVLPVTGSREALFAFAQCVVDASCPDALVLMPNPFYQIYEGAAYLAGAAPFFVNPRRGGNGPDWAAVPEEVWRRVQLLYVCSPCNPTGRVLSLQEWSVLFSLADEHGFVVASDECYSEIYGDEQAPPLGGLQAAHLLGRSDYRHLVVFSSLSKRSSVPGLRSGFVAGDATILDRFLRYRTYHGCSMSPAVQRASAAAWDDESHVRENRCRYREKFEQVLPMLSPHLAVSSPDAGFYLWARTPIDDESFARELYRRHHVLVLPGSYLARSVEGINPGAGFVRVALVASLQDCREAAQRISDFCTSL